MNISESWMAILIVVLGICVFLYGLYSITSLVKRYRAEAEEAKNADTTDAASLANLASGKHVLLTGKIAANNICDEVSKLVIYRQEKWFVDNNASIGTSQSKWKTDKVHIPAFSLELHKGEAAINANMMTRLGHEKQVVETYTPSTKNEVNGNIEGTIRHVGFKSGDEVSILGKKGANSNVHGASNEESITPLAIVGGNREQLLEFFEELINKTRYIGYAAAFCGLIVFVFGLFLMR